MEDQGPSTRVVVTGVGTVNALAPDAPRFAAALRRGDDGIGPVTLFDTSGFRTHQGAQVRGFDPRRTIPASIPLKRTSRADRFALAAACEALRQAGLFPFPAALGEAAGAVVGGGAGGLLEAEAFFPTYLEKGARRARFSLLAPLCSAATANLLAAAFGLWGPRTTLMTACSSGATAVGLARDLIRAGAARIVLAGGTEPLCRMTYAAFNALQAVDPGACRPFSGNRAGLSLGEGAGILVLESLASARERGVPVLAEVLGYGVTGDAHHMTAPEAGGAGAARAMAAALADAGVAPGAVDLILAHGTATPLNDLMETRAIKALFGEEAYRIPVSATKAMHGHTLGAAGALAAVAAVLAIGGGFLPPTIRRETADPECDLDYVTGGARAASPRVVLANAFAFGGNNTSLLLGRGEAAGEGGATAGPRRERAAGVPPALRTGGGREETHAVALRRGAALRPPRRVVVTGLGLVTPLGIGREAFAAALWAGRTAVGEIAAFPTAGFGSRLGGEIRDFDGRDFVSLKNLRKMDRLSALTAAAARMALQEAGLAVTPANRDRIGIVMGTAYGNSGLKADTARTLFTEGPAQVSPLQVPNTVLNAPAGHASIELGFRGVNTTVNHQAVSAETAIAYGAMEIRRGAAEVLLAGGAEILSPLLYEALTRFFALSPGRHGGAEGARPFDRGRNGFVLGEGCGLLCLEAADHAAARGAAVLAEITGWGLAGAPAPSTAWPRDPRGLTLALERALAQAGTTPAGIDVVAAAARGGVASDALEAAAYRVLFAGGRVPPVTALAGATGEIFAGGGIRAAALILSLQAGRVAPAVGLTDPLDDLPVVTGGGLQRPLQRGLLAGHSFGGACAALVLERRGAGDGVGGGPAVVFPSGGPA